jgi:hypothetical protein
MDELRDLRDSTVPETLRITDFQPKKKEEVTKGTKNHTKMTKSWAK